MILCLFLIGSYPYFERYERLIINNSGENNENIIVINSNFTCICSNRTGSKLFTTHHHLRLISMLMVMVARRCPYRASTGLVDLPINTEVGIAPADGEVVLLSFSTNRK